MTPHDLIVAFDTVADAPEGIKRLRAFVLELAVRGRLVPQDPKDEQASVLLGYIVGEKARLVREGKLSKATLADGLSAVGETEVSFPVPGTWRWVRFGQICDTRLGKMLDKAKNTGTLRPYLRNANLRWFRFDLSDVLELRLEDDEVEEHSIRIGDLLICEGGEPGRAAVCDESVAGMAFQKALHRARPYARINSNYLAYLLRSDTWAGRLEPRFTGATIKHFTGQALQAYPVPLPPLAEQHRIVARVDELMDLLDRLKVADTVRNSTRSAARDAALAGLREAADAEEVEAGWTRVAGRLDDLCVEPEDVKPLRQAVLELAVRGRLIPQNAEDEPATTLLERIQKRGEEVFKSRNTKKHDALSPLTDGEVPFALPKSWLWVRLGELTEKLTDGEHISPSKTTTGMPLLTATNVTDHGVDMDAPQFVSIEDGEKFRKRCDPKRGDVLICSRGTIGRCCVVMTDDVFCLMGSVILVRFLDGIPAYFNRYLSTERAQKRMRGMSGATAVQALYLKDIRLCPVALPPLSEQRRIVAKVEQLMGILDRLETKLREAQETQAAFAAAAVHNLDTGNTGPDEGLVPAA